MKQVLPVQADTLAEFAEALNNAYAELSRFTVEKTERFSGLEALIYYDIPDELTETTEEQGGSNADYNIELPHACDDTVTIRIKVADIEDRRCCECDNYDWGKGCPYRDGHIRQMDSACKMFNIIIEGRF